MLYIVSSEVLNLSDVHHRETSVLPHYGPLVGQGLPLHHSLHTVQTPDYQGRSWPSRTTNLRHLFIHCMALDVLKSTTISLDAVLLSLDRGLFPYSPSRPFSLHNIITV